MFDKLKQFNEIEENKNPPMVPSGDFYFQFIKQV